MQDTSSLDPTEFCDIYIPVLLDLRFILVDIIIVIIIVVENYLDSMAMTKYSDEFIFDGHETALGM